MKMKFAASATHADAPRGPKGLCLLVGSGGQALVEFTLIFVLMLIIAWIPADFGLAFYTGQIAQNAARETARIAAAEKTLPALPTDCAYPCGSAAELLQVAAKRIPAAILNGGHVYLRKQNSGTCNELLEVEIKGKYYYSFYRMLNFIGAATKQYSDISRIERARWEHQPGCVGGGTP